jgi:hypothetical protein
MSSLFRVPSLTVSLHFRLRERAAIQLFLVRIDTWERSQRVAMAMTMSVSEEVPNDQA